MNPPFAPDLDAYFARIGYTGPREATLTTLHAVLHAHVSSIPFENLDVLLGRGIDLDPAAIEQKLVHGKRGGYCFEQNTLLLHVLTALGYLVTPLSARVRLLRPREFTPPRTHLFLRVELDGVPWVADAGVGSASLTTCIRLDLASEQATAHEPRRITREDGRSFHQIRLGEDWSDVYEFTGEAMPPIDRELANWWTSTNPGSKFCQSLAVARSGPDGTRYAIRDREFVYRCGATTLEQIAITTPEQLLAVLAQHFGLHFPAGTRFGGPGKAWPT